MASNRTFKLSARDRERLLHLADHQCAICHRDLGRYDPATKTIRYVAEAAHIYPHLDGGERGDAANRPQLVDDPSNLLMLCPGCHRWIDYRGVGATLFPIDKLRAIKREHEAWVAFKRSRQQENQVPAAAAPPAVGGLRRGQSVSVDGQSYRLAGDERPGRVDSVFAEERSAGRDAVRSRSYAYAETGAARHAWLRRVEARDGSEVGERWRRELVEEARLLDDRLPRLPGLPPVLGIAPLPNESFVLVTALPSAVSMADRYGTDAAPALREESVRSLFAGLPTLCAALGALHDINLAHGALDPQAILVDQRGNLVLRDLGLATAETEERPSKQQDIGRLAAVVYAFITGSPPLTGADGPPVPADLRNPAISDREATVLSEALTGGVRDARSLGRGLHPVRRKRKR